MKAPDPLQTAPSSRLRRAWSVIMRWLQPAGDLGDRLRYAWSRPVVCLVIPALSLILLPAMGLVHHIYFDRSDLPDLERFVRFELPTTGLVYDARGKVLIELAREYRRVISYDEVPVILRQAILSAEDKNFFSHSGVEYGALPRVVMKTVVRSVAEWWKGDTGFRLRFAQGGSTLTQQLVRGYFLRDRTRGEGGGTLFRTGFTSRLLAAGLGVPATNKLLRKLEEVRLALWLEKEMLERYGSQEKAKREIFARSANLLYLGDGRYGFAAASEHYFGRTLASYTSEDAGKAALLAGIMKSPREYAPVPGEKGRKFKSLEAQNEWLLHWEDRWASRRIHGRVKRQVEEMFQEEKRYLQPLPLMSFRYFKQETRTVYDDGTTQVGQSYYAASPAPIGSKVVVRIYEDQVEILDPIRMEVIRRHPKSRRPGSLMMEPADRIFNPSRETDRLLNLAGRTLLHYSIQERMIGSKKPGVRHDFVVGSRQV